MDDLEKREADITAELWEQISRVEKRITTVRNALHHSGPSSTLTMVAGVLAEEAMDLLKTAAKGEGHADAVRMM